MAQATWARQPLHGSLWVLQYPCCHQMITQTTPGATEGLQKKSRFFQVPLNSPSKSNFGAFGGPMARATWAQRPPRGSPWVLKYPYCHQMITQTQPRADRQVSEKLEF